MCDWPHKAQCTVVDESVDSSSSSHLDYKNLPEITANVNNLIGTFHIYISINTNQVTSICNVISQIIYSLCDRSKSNTL